MDYFRAQHLAWWSNGSFSNNKPLYEAINSGDTQEIRSVLNKYKQWQSLAKRVKSDNLILFDDPNCYLEEIMRWRNLDTMKEFMDDDIDLQINDDDIKNFMTRCHTSKCDEKLYALLNYRNIRERCQENPELMDKNIELIVDHYSDYYDVDKIKSIQNKFGPVKISSKSVEKIIDVNPTKYQCEKRLDILKKFSSNFSVDYDDVYLHNCKCSNVLSFLLEKQEIKSNINAGKDTWPNKSPLLSAKYRYYMTYRNDTQREQALQAFECIKILESHGAKTLLEGETSNVEKLFKTYGSVQKEPYEMSGPNYTWF
ncbi:hypothetical protein QLL95_gp0524 [Cotonvirus japonicus]|uniref:Uncharacterized protein n=1 Tax=Cotonvirus japonicus TaxID=2811091 RepID=A0ABM7NTZ4_9VIRU|nr:hypothetical protein QLL95_gp0524 [Cotonvirus japonicus]BCS83599.1 hypothetical protein [Cotonvirus japonicus]